MRKYLLNFAAGLICFMALVSRVFAADVNLDDTGVAVQGYDVVAYFTQSAAVKGTSNFTADFEGGTYQFSSSKHRDMFVASPAKYIPAYGGFCAYGVAQGAKVPIQPDLFAIVDDKLYLNINPQVQTIWEKDKPGYIAQADNNWVELGQ